LNGGNVVAGGELIVQRGGAANHTQVSGRGATMLVQNGATASGTTVAQGGLLGVFAGGTASATQVNSGGREIVGAGATTGNTLISGGMLEIARGAVGSGTITLASSGGGVLQLDDAQHFGGLVAGFGQPDLIDLRDIAFGSGTSVSYVSG